MSYFDYLGATPPLFADNTLDKFQPLSRPATPPPPQQNAMSNLGGALGRAKQAGGGLMGLGAALSPSFASGLAGAAGGAGAGAGLGAALAF